jgi:hypothetical protein
MASLDTLAGTSTFANGALAAYHALPKAPKTIDKAMVATAFTKCSECNFKLSKNKCFRCNPCTYCTTNGLKYTWHEVNDVKKCSANKTSSTYSDVCFILDSGATISMVVDKKILSSFSNYISCKILELFPY